MHKGLFDGSPVDRDRTEKMSPHAARKMGFKSRWLHSTRCTEYPPTYYCLLRRKYFIEKIGQAKNPANYLQLKPPDFSFPPPSGSGSEAAVERLPPSLSVGPLPILAASRHWSLYTPTDGDGDEDERGLLLAKTRIHAESKKKKPE